MWGAKWRCIIFKLLLESTARVTVAAAAAAAGEENSTTNRPLPSLREEKSRNDRTLDIAFICAQLRMVPVISVNPVDVVFD